MCLANGENAVRKGNYSILPDKFARLLYEFHDFQFAGLDRQIEVTFMSMGRLKTI
jgi:hypothetical protein